MTSLQAIDNLIQTVEMNIRKSNAFFTRYIHEKTERKGLFIASKIGAKQGSDFKGFGDAYHALIHKVSAHIRDKNLWEYFDEHGVNICPDCPITDENIRCFTGFILNDSCGDNNINIEKFETAEIKVITMKPPEWCIYKYIGKYADNKVWDGWAEVSEQSKSRGYREYEGMCYFEQYFDENWFDKQNETLTIDIWCGITK